MNWFYQIKYCGCLLSYTYICLLYVSLLSLSWVSTALIKHYHQSADTRPLSKRVLSMLLQKGQVSYFAKEEIMLHIDVFLFKSETGIIKKVIIF